MSKYNAISLSLDKVLKDIATTHELQNDVKKDAERHLEKKRKEIESSFKKSINREVRKIQEEMHDKNDLTKMFRDHALEIYGASVLENS